MAESRGYYRVITSILLSIMLLSCYRTMLLLLHIGAQTILVTNLVTNSVTNLSPNLVITKQSDKFVTKFVTDIGVHQIW